MSPRRGGLAELIAAGVRGSRAELVADYMGHTITAKVLDGGDVEMNGQRYSSPAAAASAAQLPFKGADPNGKAPSTNGWVFWRVKDGKSGEMVTLDVLRQRG